MRFCRYQHRASDEMSSLVGAQPLYQAGHCIGLFRSAEREPNNGTASVAPLDNPALPARRKPHIDGVDTFLTLDPDDLHGRSP